MTIDEFIEQATVALQTRKMETWERVDLLIIVRHVKARGFVAPTDLLILRWSGNPITGHAPPVARPPTYARPVQVKLF